MDFFVGVCILNDFVLKFFEEQGVTILETIQLFSGERMEHDNFTIFYPPLGLFLWDPLIGDTPIVSGSLESVLISI